MALKNTFRQKLDALWHRRTEVLLRSLHLVGRGRPISTRITHDDRRELQALAERVLVQNGARQALQRMIPNDCTCRRRPHQNRIMRWESKQTLVDWARATIRYPAVYSFWEDGRCLYVGRAENLATRLRSYVQHKSVYLRAGRRINVWCIRSQRRLSRAECIAISLLRPPRSNNRNKASHRKYDRRCKICLARHQIREVLSALR